MNAEAVISRIRDLGISLRVDGDKLKYAPKSAMSPELLTALRSQKSEIMAHLQGRPLLADGPPEWHAEQIARCVAQEGICVFWSELFGEIIAFIRAESDRQRVPAQIVAYTCEELRHLFREDADEATLRLVHEAKKLGGVVK